ncbi:hypothetical protein Ancab_029787, partial [Ancistrocladus abbreviatus]
PTKALWGYTHVPGTAETLWTLLGCGWVRVGVVSMYRKDLPQPLMKSSLRLLTIAGQGRGTVAVVLMHQRDLTLALDEILIEAIKGYMAAVRNKSYTAAKVKKTLYLKTMGSYKRARNS